MSGVTLWKLSGGDLWVQVLCENPGRIFRGYPFRSGTPEVAPGEYYDYFSPDTNDSDFLSEFTFPKPNLL